MASLMGKSVEKTGWPTHFTDHQTIKMEDLPLHAKHPDKPIPTETVIIKDRMDHFKRIGIMPLTAIDRKDIAFASIETTVAGSSLRYHLFLSLFTKFIFWCLDTFEKQREPASIENNFRQAMALFFEKRGSRSPVDIHVSAGTLTSENRIPLKISFTPPNDVLPSKEKVELEFLW